MTWLYKLALATVATLAIGTPLMANGPGMRPRTVTLRPQTQARYAVYFRYSPSQSWGYYATYQRQSDARYVADLLEYYYGGQTFIRRVR